MATLTIADLDNGQRDLQTVGQIANSPADTTVTRYGDSVLTLAGALRRLGYKAPVPYASGLTVDSGLFTVSRDSVIYAPDPALVPFITGAWNAAQWRPVQNTANTNLVYQFPTLGAAESAAPTLPAGSAVVVEGVSQGHVIGGAYVADSGAPAVTLNDYSDLRAYTVPAAVDLTGEYIGGRFVHRPDLTAVDNNATTIVLNDSRVFVREDAFSRNQAEWSDSLASGVAVSAVAKKNIHIGSDYALSAPVQLDKDGIVGEGRTLITAPSGGAAALRLGWNNSGEHGWRYRPVRDLVINVPSNGLGIEYNDSITPSYSGRWSLQNVCIYGSGTGTGISKPTGNIGNSYNDVNFRGLQYGFRSQSTDVSPVMHGGCDLFFGGEASTCTGAAFFIKSPLFGTGQTVFDGTVIQDNPGCGVVVFGYKNSYVPLTFRNTWFENNATAATTNVDGVNVTPVDLWLRDVDLAVLRDGNLRKTKLENNSRLIADNVSTDSHTFLDVDGGSEIIINGLNFQDFPSVAAFKSVVVRSVAQFDSTLTGYTAPAFRMPLRDKSIVRPSSTYLYSGLTYGGTSSIPISGSSTLNSSQIDGSQVFQKAALYELTGGGQWRLTGQIGVTPGRYYVWYATVRKNTGNDFDLFFGGDVPLSPNMKEAANSGVWTTIAGISACPSGASGNVAIQIAAPAGTSYAEVSACGIAEFGTKSEALAFLNSQEYIAP